MFGLFTWRPRKQERRDYRLLFKDKLEDTYKNPAEQEAEARRREYTWLCDDDQYIRNLPQRRKTMGTMSHDRVHFTIPDNARTIKNKEHLAELCEQAFGTDFQLRQPHPTLPIRVTCRPSQWGRFTVLRALMINKKNTNLCNTVADMELDLIHAGPSGPENGYVVPADFKGQYVKFDFDGDWLHIDCDAVREYERVLKQAFDQKVCLRERSVTISCTYEQLGHFTYQLDSAIQCGDWVDENAYDFIGCMRRANTNQRACRVRQDVSMNPYCPT